jgi:hypothetical protein
MAIDGDDGDELHRVVKVCTVMSLLLFSNKYCGFDLGGMIIDAWLMFDR